MKNNNFNWKKWNNFIHLNESTIFKGDDKELSKIADSFVRYIIGNRKTALNELSKYKFEVDVSSDPDNYNELYENLHEAIFKLLLRFL